MPSQLVPVAAAVLVLLLGTGAGAQTTTTTTATTSTTSSTLPPCGFVGAVDVWAVNESGQPSVTIDVDGDLDPAAATCSGAALADHYARSFTCAGAGLVRCRDGTGAPARVNGLRPGAWIHRLTVTVPPPAGEPANDPQQQARRGVVIAPDGTPAVNPVVWTIHGFTRALTTASGTELRAALAAAGAWTAANPGRRALVTLRPPSPVTLTQASCAPDPACGLAAPKAGLCVEGDRIVLDGRDPDGRRFAELNVGTLVQPVVRVYGSDVELRGLVVRGTRSAVAVQADTIDFMSSARRSAVADCTVLGPSKGDAIGAQCGAGGSDADANLVADSLIRAAQDKGVKVASGAVQVVSRSCVADNTNGGIQATLGGRAIARENVVQHNVPDQAENGIFANDSAGGPSSVTTRGNIVRFSGNRGLSVVDNALGDFHDDYVARNQYVGARVETTRAGATPAAAFTGVAFVCNKVAWVSATCSSPAGKPCIDVTDCDTGATCTTTFPDGVGLSIGFPPTGPCACSTPPCACTAPTVTLGDGGAAGAEIALTKNRRDLAAAGRNLDAGVPGGTLGAGGTQWESCSDAQCVPGFEAAVAAADVRAATGATVGMAPLVSSVAHTPSLESVSPARPRAGDIVRVYGRGFDAVNGNALSTACQNAPDRDADFCDPSEPELAQINRGANGNRLRLFMRGTQLAQPPSWTLDLVAVTPTMLAFRMPVDCFGPGKLRIGNATPFVEIPICDPEGCSGQPAGLACPDDGKACTTDVCDGAGTCTHPPLATGTVCRAATDLCDAPEVCDGAGADCPADANYAPGVVCRPPSDLCDKPETCTGGKACPADQLWNIGHVCRPDTAPCDTAEKCDGTTATCPPDGVEPATTVCRASAGACDVLEHCDGSHRDCPADAVRAAGTACRSAKGECDLAEACDGVAATCPADAKRTDVCRPAAGPCDVAEACTGDAAACPPDVKAQGTVCRAAAGPCDLAEACDGVGDACPADAKRAAGTDCRAAADACDAVERCDGSSDACPPDVLATAGVVCRAASHACDLVETCTGTDAGCPADVEATGFDALACRLHQIDAVIRQGCEPQRQVMQRLLTRATQATSRGEQACATARIAASRRQLRRVERALARLQGLIARSGCLAGIGTSGTATTSAAVMTLRETRAALPTRCVAGG